MTKDFCRIDVEKLNELAYDDAIHEIAAEIISTDKDSEPIAFLLSEGAPGVSPYFEMFHPRESFSPENSPARFAYHDEDEVRYILGMIDGWAEGQLMDVYQQKGIKHHTFRHVIEGYLPELIRKTLSLVELFRKASAQEQVVVVITDC